MANYIGSNLASNITGSDFADNIWGNGGDDILNGAGGGDLISGGSGNDYIIGGTGADIMSGGSGIDTLSYVNDDSGLIIYLNDTTYGGEASGDLTSGFENVICGNGDDNIYGDASNNMLFGGGGSDYLSGGAGNDQMFGGAHGDFMLAGEGSDHYDGGSGTDAVGYHKSLAGVEIDLQLFTARGGLAAGDTLQSIEEIGGTDFSDILGGDAEENTFHGSGGNDTLFGRGGDDGLFGGEGGDRLTGGTDADYLDGGEGEDTAQYLAAVTVSLDGSLVATGDAAGDLFVSIENLSGSDEADELRGNDERNVIDGGDGNSADILSGRGGNDTLIGGNGDDIMSGGNGNDVFVYWNLANCGDTINGFSSSGVGNNDTIRLAAANFGGLPEGALGANRFIANASGQAETAGQRFIYETDTGILRYDANGSNGGGVTIIATLSGAPAFTIDDIDMMVL